MEISTQHIPQQVVNMLNEMKQQMMQQEAAQESLVIIEDGVVMPNAGAIANLFAKFTEEELVKKVAEDYQKAFDQDEDLTGQYITVKGDGYVFHPDAVMELLEKYDYKKVIHLVKGEFIAQSGSNTPEDFEDNLKDALAKSATEDAMSAVEDHAAKAIDDIIDLVVGYKLSDEVSSGKSLIAALKKGGKFKR